MEDLIFNLEGIVHEKDELKDFEGPLSLILLLLQKNKIEIRDIRVSLILDQYLEYLDSMKQMNLEVASEFVQMAAYLLYIKTKTLIAQDKEEVSELELLIESLEQLKAKDTYRAVKEVTPAMLEAYKKGALIVSKGPAPMPDIPRDYPYHHTTEELLKALLQVFADTGEKPQDLDAIKAAMPARIVYSVKSKSRQILERLKLRNVTLKQLYAECTSRSEVVATFMSVLELVSMGSIVVSVSSRRDDYELCSAGGDVDEILERIEE